MSLALQKIVDEIKELAPEQRRHVREMLGETETTETELHQREEDFHQKLYAKGLLIKIPHENIQRLPFDDWEPVKIKGKPISETIIEERR